MAEGFHAAFWFAGFLGLYLLLAGTVSVTEAGAGAAVASATTGFVLARRQAADRAVALPLPPAHAVLRPLGALLSDTLRVGAVLARALVQPQSGQEARQPFRPGDDTAEEAGRRGLATLLLSLAPNGFVLDVPPAAAAGDGAAVLLHRLAPASRPASPGGDADWPA